MSVNSTVDEKEINNFSLHASSWWDFKGPYASLHALNPVRLRFIHSILKDHLTEKPSDLLDVGCGGGLVCEPLSRLGYKVTGIDACEKAIEVAKNHAQEVGLTIEYSCTSSEQLAIEQKKFPAITCLELIEHVENPALLLKSLSDLLLDNGVLILSTLNRTTLSYLKGILAAEWVLKWVPKGTHTWSKFIKPSELEELASVNGLTLKRVQGLSYSPFRGFFLSPELDTNYFAVFVKK